jgi:hypothetical protein
MQQEAIISIGQQIMTSAHTARQYRDISVRQHVMKHGLSGIQDHLLRKHVQLAQLSSQFFTTLYFTSLTSCNLAVMSMYYMHHTNVFDYLSTTKFRKCQTSINLREGHCLTHDTDLLQA